MEEYIIKEYADGRVLKVSDVHRVLLKMIKDIDVVCRKHNIPYWLCGGSALGAVRHQGFIPWDDDMDICMLREDYERFLAEAAKDLGDQYAMQCFELDKRANVCVPAKVMLKGTHIEEYNFLLKNRIPHGDGLFIDIFVCDHLATSKRKDMPPRITSLLGMGIITLLENLHINPIPLKNWYMHHAIAYGKRQKDSDSIGFAITWCFNSMTHPVRYPIETVFPTQYVRFEDTMLPIPKDPHPMLDIEVSPKHMSLPPIKDQRPKHIKDAIL